MKCMKVRNYNPKIQQKFYYAFTIFIRYGGGPEVSSLNECIICKVFFYFVNQKLPYFIIVYLPVYGAFASACSQDCQQSTLYFLAFFYLLPGFLLSYNPK